MGFLDTFANPSGSGLVEIASNIITEFALPASTRDLYQRDFMTVANGTEERTRLLYWSKQ